MEFNLIDMRNNRSIVKNLLEMRLKEVGDTNSPDLARLQEQLHGPPSVKNRGSIMRLRPVKEVEVNIVRLDVSQGLCCGLLDIGVVAWPEFGRDEQILVTVKLTT